MNKVLGLADLLAGLLSHGEAAQKPLTRGFACQHPPHTVSIVSRSPLVMCLHDFITAEERAHLQTIRYGGLYHLRARHNHPANWSIARVAFCFRAWPAQQAKNSLNSVRTSQLMSVETDDVTRCIEQRALDGCDHEAHPTLLVARNTFAVARMRFPRRFGGIEVRDLKAT